LSARPQRPLGQREIAAPAALSGASGGRLPSWTPGNPDRPDAAVGPTPVPASGFNSRGGFH
jgi:hypothetical protein